MNGEKEEIVFCILDNNSRFKNFVVNESMLRFLQNGMVKYKRTCQEGKGKPIVNFLYGDQNLASGRLLYADEVKHIDQFGPGKLTQGKPHLVLDPAQVAKTFFMCTSRSKKKVLDDIERAFNQQATTANEHVEALQVAWGGGTSDLAPSGRFVKCPVQVQNSEGASGKLLT
jgi:hypothetical protein